MCKTVCTCKSVCTGIYSYTGTLWVDAGTQERGLPAVQILLDLTGQLKLPVVLIHIPDRQKEVEREGSRENGIETNREREVSEIVCVILFILTICVYQCVCVCVCVCLCMCERV